MVLFVGIACSKEDSEVAPHKKNLEWFTNLETALEIAKAEQKAVLVNFTGSDWCPWCWRIRDEIFVEKEFEDFAKEKLILVELDFPRSIPQTDEVKQYNRALATKYGIEGFPTILILDSAGKVLLQTGYKAGGSVPYIAMIEEYLK
jgi:protein disulfide-isomerase